MTNDDGRSEIGNNFVSVVFIAMIYNQWMGLDGKMCGLKWS